MIGDDLIFVGALHKYILDLNAWTVMNYDSKYFSFMCL